MRGRKLPHNDNNDKDDNDGGIDFNFNVNNINNNNNNNNTKKNSNIKFSLQNLPHVPNLESSNPIMKNIDGVWYGLVQESNQKFEFSSGLNKFFLKVSEIFLDEKTLNAENEIQISPNLKKLSESLQKSETPIDLELLHGVEDQDFKNMQVMQGLDSDMEKLADFLSIPKCAQIKREITISIHLETENISFVNQNL